VNARIVTFGPVAKRANGAKMNEGNRANDRAFPRERKERVMTDFWTERESAPAFDVRVMRHGNLIHHEYCEAASQVNDLSREWADMDGVAIEVVDLMTADPAGAELEIDLYDDDNEYP
jgi:hypothetical protein